MEEFVEDLKRILDKYETIINKKENGEDIFIDWKRYNSPKLLEKTIKLLEINYKLWQLEDKCRDYRKSEKKIGNIKKKIDKLNQKRNDFKDEIDVHFAKKYKPEPPKIDDEDSRLFVSDTVGGILDRISIIALKIYYHRKIEDSKGEIEEKTENLHKQFNFLVQTLEQNLNLIDENNIALMPLKEFKMYNNPELNPNLKVEFLYLDFVVYSGCNQSCDYCRDEPKRKNTEIHDKIHSNLDHILSLANPHILKISGYGEFTLIPNYIEILEEYSSDFEKIQLITNGTNLTSENLRKISKINNINICFSLDGINSKSNQLRTENKQVIKNIKGNIKSCIELDILTEINTVLTKYNIDDYFSLVDEFSSLTNDGLIFYPFPLRDLQGGKYDYNEISAKKGQIKKFKEKYFSKNEEENKFLPPGGYMKRLINMMEGNFTKTHCAVPKVNLGVSPEGKWLKCPCSGTKKDHGKIKKMDDLNAVYENIDHKLPSKVCKTCFNHYDINNAFIDGKISLEELSNIDLFNTEKILNFLSYYKNNM